VVALRSGVEVLYGACGTNLVWWTKQQQQGQEQEQEQEQEGGLQLQLGGSVMTGESEDVGAAHLCVDREGRFLFTANYGRKRTLVPSTHTCLGETVEQKQTREGQTL
jgi:6-phosphogluconolactonase (cycloisomerase 2 family)